MGDSAEPVLDRMDHVAIAVRDVDASLGYYTGTLGLVVVGDERVEEPGVRLIYLDAGGVFLQLVSPFRPGPVADFLERRGEGLHHVCFAVPDIARALERIAGEGDARVFLGGRGRRACFLTGTANGALVELTELEPIAPAG